MNDIDRNTELLACREMVRMFTDYFEDALPLEQRLRFEEHLSLCDGCTDYMDQMRHVVAAAGELSASDLPKELRSGYLEAFAMWKGRRGA